MQRCFSSATCLIDTFMRHRPMAEESSILQDMQLADGERVRPYGILTLHKPANIRDNRILSPILNTFIQISKRMPILFPVHPEMFEWFQDKYLSDYPVDHFICNPEPWDGRMRLRLIPQLGYVDFIRLMSEARVVFTDSGGIQDETTMLGVPCITLEDTTERPITLKQGTNVLAGSNPEKIIREFNRARRKRNTVNRSPRYWDGKAANRIIKVLFDDFCSSRSIAAPDSGVEGDRQERSHSAAARSSHPGRFSSRL